MKKGSGKLGQLQLILLHVLIDIQHQSFLGLLVSLAFCLSPEEDSLLLGHLWNSGFKWSDGFEKISGPLKSKPKVRNLGSID